jgi:transcription initiation factor IIE alpha subunit
LPQALIKSLIRRTADAICRKTADVSEEERKVHRFVVMTMTETNEPVTSEYIAEKLHMPLNRVRDIVDKLEEMKVFFYRYNNQGINWAYPVTAENVVHKTTFSTGEQCNAA